MIPTPEKIIEETLNIILHTIPATAGIEVIKIKTKEIYEWAKNKLKSGGEAEKLDALMKEPENVILKKNVVSGLETVLQDEQSKHEIIRLLDDFKAVVAHNFQENKKGSNELTQEVGQMGTSFGIINKQMNEEGKNIIKQTFGI